MMWETFSRFTALGSGEQKKVVKIIKYLHRYCRLIQNVLRSIQISFKYSHLHISHNKLDNTKNIED